MRRRAGLAVIVAAALLAPAARAAEVNVQFQAFAPQQTEILPGESVTWTNVSERLHTVTASDGSFDTGDFPGGATFAYTFPAVGSFPYHCTIHPTMTGEVDVRRVLLDSLPPAPVPAGSAVEFSGRAADPAAAVRIERDGGAAGFQTVATAHPAPDGTWKTSIPATSTGDYRASVGADTSSTRRLLVIDRSVLVRATRHGVNVEVVPHLPGAVVVLQLHLRDRFGWWPAQRVRLDYVSRATFRCRGHRPHAWCWSTPTVGRRWR